MEIKEFNVGDTELFYKAIYELHRLKSTLNHVINNLSHVQLYLHKLITGSNTYHEAKDLWYSVFLHVGRIEFNVEHELTNGKVYAIQGYLDDWVNGFSPTSSATKFLEEMQEVKIELSKLIPQFDRIERESFSLSSRTSIGKYHVYTGRNAGTVMVETVPLMFTIINVDFNKIFKMLITSQVNLNSSQHMLQQNNETPIPPNIVTNADEINVLIDSIFSKCDVDSLEAKIIEINATTTSALGRIKQNQLNATQLDRVHMIETLIKSVDIRWVRFQVDRVLRELKNLIIDPDLRTLRTEICKVANETQGLWCYGPEQHLIFARLRVLSLYPEDSSNIRELRIVAANLLQYIMSVSYGTAELIALTTEISEELPDI